MFVIWIMGLSLGLIFMGAMMVDFWRVFSERRALADLADGAVVVGSQQIDVAYFNTTGTVQLLPYDQVATAVCSYLDANSPQTTCSNGGATVNVPDATHVQVQIKSNVKFLALGVLPDKSGRLSQGIDVTASSSAEAHQIGP